MSASFLDPDRTVFLHAYGLPGFSAAVAVGADGAEHLVLVNEWLLGDAHSNTYDRPAWAQHMSRLGHCPTVGPTGLPGAGMARARRREPHALQPQNQDRRALSDAGRRSR